LRRFLIGLIIVIVIAVVAAFALSYRPAIDPIAPPARSTFDAALIQKGAVLAEVGDCVVCHTPAGGKLFAGGLAVPTPFGTIYSTNITPDPDTGIGRWSQAAFDRALRQGVSRDGHLLYPAFPFDHFTHISDDDMKALYAFMMTREPVSSRPPANQLLFPIGFRPVMAGWDLLFLKAGPAPSDPSKSADWNRGAYLAESLGHCASCHTPRNFFGAESTSQAYAGAPVEQWIAPALNAASPAPIPWTVDSMTAYLRRGWADLHSVSAGPMQLVYHNLGDIPEGDVRAIATYLVDLAGPPSADRQQRATDAQALVAQNVAAKPNPNEAEGQAIFDATCNTCHRDGGPTLAGRLPMALYSAVNAPSPRNLINVILQGVQPVSIEPSPIMPPFGAVLTDAQLTTLVGYVRSRYSAEPAWADVAAQIASARQGSAAR
jgi:mono/diheme cytochrome c family protein